MMTKTGIVFHPLYVAQTSSRTVSLEKLLKKPHVITQSNAISNFATRVDTPFAKPSLINRTQAKFDPATDNVFQKLLSITEDDSATIIVDNFLRLIDCRDYKRAIAQFDYLRKNAPTLLSIEHGALVKTISVKTTAATIAARVESSTLRSENIKKGLKKNAELYGGSKPTRRAIDKGSKVKSRIADVKAQALFPKIERVRQSMPFEVRDNLKAIADAMNAAGVETPSGRGQWQRTTLERVLDRIERINEVASN